MNLMAEEAFSHLEKKSLLSMPVNLEEKEANAREKDHATEKEAEDHLQETNVSSAAKQATGRESVQKVTEVEIAVEEATETVDQGIEIMLEEKEGASLVEARDILLETVERIEEMIRETVEGKVVEEENQLELGSQSVPPQAILHHGLEARSKKTVMIDMRERLTESTRAEVASEEDREAILTPDQDLDLTAIHTIPETKSSPVREAAKEVEGGEEAELLIPETEKEGDHTQKTRDLDQIHIQEDQPAFQDPREVRLLEMLTKIG